MPIPIRSLVLTSALALGGFALPTVADTFSGAFLAANQADARNDYQTAARFYTRALARLPNDARLLQSAAVARVATGDVDMAATLAQQLAEKHGQGQVSSLVLVADHMAKGNFENAKTILAGNEIGMNPLLQNLLQGWAEMGLGRFTDAVAVFDGMTENDAYTLYGQYHKALATAMVGDFAGAEALFADSGNGEPLHLNRAAMLAHVQILAQLDRTDEALEILDRSLASGFTDEQFEALRARIAAGEAVDYVVATEPVHGASEAYLTLATELNRQNVARVALLHGRLAAHLRPDGEEAHLLSAQILDNQEQYDLAIDAYSVIDPQSPWFISAELGRADALERSGKLDGALEVMRHLAKIEPQRLSVMNGLGDMLRQNERYDEASEAYTKALALLETENESHWVLYYSRGITYERTDRWDQAEADFRRALELRPDQPLVLNYLGYSLVELRRNLEEAQEMIEKAVAERPQDGYITDSLAWVLYRLGKFEEAVPVQERAVELLPVDPILNDHLGDIYWMVDRKREAEFQWRRALSFEPEDEDAERIRLKLEIGLDAVLEDEKEKEELAPATAQDQ